MGRKSWIKASDVILKRNVNNPVMAMIFQRIFDGRVPIMRHFLESVVMPARRQFRILAVSGLVFLVLVLNSALWSPAFATDSNPVPPPVIMIEEPQLPEDTVAPSVSVQCISVEARDAPQLGTLFEQYVDPSRYDGIQVTNDHSLWWELSFSELVDSVEDAVTDKFEIAG